MKSTALLSTALCCMHVQGQTYTPVNEGSLDDTTHTIASVSAEQPMYPFTLSPGVVENYTGNDSFSNMTSFWNTNLAVVENGTSFRSLLSVSSPRGEGPDAPIQTPPWGVCAVAMPGLFETLGIQPVEGTDPSCMEMGLTEKCYNFLVGDMLGYFDSGIADAPGNITAACEGLARVHIPPFCFHGHEDEDTEGKVTMFKGYTKLNPQNGTAFLASTDKDEGARAKALARVWPVVLVEFAGNSSEMSSMSCPVAAAAKHISESNNTSSGGATQDKPTKNSAQSATGGTKIQLLLPVAGIVLFVLCA